MVKRKPYSKPEITKIELDRSINLMMQSPPMDPMMMPTMPGTKGADTPFTSPFGDKPFS